MKYLFLLLIILSTLLTGCCFSNTNHKNEREKCTTYCYEHGLSYDAGSTSTCYENGEQNIQCSCIGT